MANVNERSLRSVFVGNIPYDASEEKLKEIFSEVGPVLSFKLVYDRESGKPKGYGFCEYRDQETAMSAMRNLNGYDLNGRNLRVDTATNEKFKEEIKNLQFSLTGNSFESSYGAEVDPEKAPETIAKVVSSLPPEQMYEIARQMKHCVLSNPNEARNMLLQNPQLGYALLQMLVIIKAVDINTASMILYKPNPLPINIAPAGVGQPVISGGLVPSQQPPGHIQMMNQPPQSMMQPTQPMHQAPPQMFDDFNRVPPVQSHQAFDQRHLDPRLRQQNETRAPDAVMYDPRIAAQSGAAPPPPIDPRLRDPRQQQQPTTQPNVPQAIRVPAVVAAPTAVPAAAIPPSQSRILPNQQAMFAQAGNFAGAAQQQQSTVTPPGASVTSSPNIVGSVVGQPNQAVQSEAEKAQLIMQVLSLSDQQINMLPADQRQSILVLRQQLAANQGK